MLILQSFFALIVAVIVTTLAGTVIQSGRKRDGFLWLFVIVFLTTWAGGLWLRPFGPTLWGTHWLPFLLVGLILALIVIVTTPPRPPRNRRETLKMLEEIQNEKELERVSFLTLSVFFWILLFALILSIVIKYLLKP